MSIAWRARIRKPGPCTARWTTTWGMLGPRVSLYACGPFFQECALHDWAFVVTFKPTVLPTVWTDFQSLLSLVPEQRVERILPDGTRQIYRWVNNLSYLDSAQRSWNLNALQCEESVPDKDPTTF